MKLTTKLLKELGWEQNKKTKSWSYSEKLPSHFKSTYSVKTSIEKEYLYKYNIQKVIEEMLKLSRHNALKEVDIAIYNISEGKQK